MYYKGKESRLEKNLSPFTLLAFGLGNILGPQLFLMLAGLISLSGTAGIISLIVCSFICVLIAFNYLELGLAMPMTGLVINATNDAFGGFTSFVAGWSQLFSNVSFAAVCALGFGTYLGQLVGKPGLVSVFAILIVILITLVELRGITDIGKLDLILVFIILSFFLSLIVANGSNYGTLSGFSFDFSGIGSIKKILFGISFFFLAFTNFEDMVTYSEEISDIRKLPKVMMGAIAIVSIFFISIYLLLVSGILNNDVALLSDPLIGLSNKIYGSFSSILIALIAIAASITSLLGSLSSSSRNAFSMAEKGFMPKILYDAKSNKIPPITIIFSSILAIFIILSGSLDVIIYLANFIYFVITICLAAAVIKLRKKRKMLERPFKVPFFPLPSLLTIFMMIFLMFFLDPKSIALGVTWLFFGFLVYMLRAVGSHRIKIAILGANFFCMVLVYALLVVISELAPALVMTIRPFLYVAIFCYLLFSLFLMIEVIMTAKKAKAGV